MPKQTIPNTEARIEEKKERWTRIVLFFILLVTYTYTFPRWADWSQNSRANLTLAIVDDHSLMVDKYMGNTGDYAHYNGHYYTDKAPGPSFAAVPIYAAARPILRSAPVQSIIDRLSRSAAFADTLNQQGTGLLTDKIYYMAVLMIITFFVITIPAAVLGVLLYSFLRRLTVQREWAIGITLVYGLGTTAFTYSSVFYSHQLAAFLLFGAFYLGFRLRRREISPAWVILAGFMLGFSLISEYPTFLIAAAIFFYIVYTLITASKKAWIAGFLGGGLVPGALMMAYDMAIFGTPLPIGYEYSENYTSVHSVGLISLTYPHPEYLWGITFGSFRGLFYVAPVLLIATAGLVIWWLWGHYRAEALVSTWATVSFFLFNGSSVMWQGGFSVGPRYLVPMLPFLALGFGPFAIRYGRRLWARILTGLLALLSLLLVWIETLGGQSFPDWTRVPLTNYSIPNVLAGDIARNWGMLLGLHQAASLLPLALFLTAGIAALYRIQVISETPRRAMEEPAEQRL